MAHNRFTPPRFRLRPSLAFFVLLLSIGVASGSELPRQEWVPPGPSGPLGEQSSCPPPPIQWVPVHLLGQSNCDPSDLVDSTMAAEEVWCFEGDGLGSGPDSSWSANVGGALGRPHSEWEHWSRFAPPDPPPSRWFTTGRNPSPGGGPGNLNAWCGCDSVGNNPGCTDTAFWLNQEGYGDNWNYALTLDMAGQNNTAGATLQFDIRYDTECNYDYLFLEYLDASGAWTVMSDAGSTAAFNGVSGNPCAVEYHGNATWLTGVVFPIPATAVDGTKVRWRGFSDAAWSDQSAGGDTDGIGAIDNVVVTFTATGDTVSDDFDASTGPTDFWSSLTSTAGSPSWTIGGPIGSSFDGWHLTFDPDYKNKGNTCFFSNDWMWSSKPDGSHISQNGFDYILASPVINVSGWNGAIVKYDQYACFPTLREDFHQFVHRTHSGSPTSFWSPWRSDGVLWYGCSPEWGFVNQDLSSFVGPGVDSLQFGWRTLDASIPGEDSWGRHRNTILLVDHVAIGEGADPAQTRFTSPSTGRLADTFSLSDPAHTAYLENVEQGDWAGAGGSRDMEPSDSLTVTVADADGLTAGNVELWWRHDNGGVGFGVWQSKAMNLSVPDPLLPTDEGEYRSMIGTDDGDAEDLTPSGDGLVWTAGTTVEYYIQVTDNAANVCRFPAPEALEFAILPLGGDFLVVNTYPGNVLDPARSSDFQPSGGNGFGNFGTPVYGSPTSKVQDALDLIGVTYDRYDDPGGGTALSAPPNGPADPERNLGGYLEADGTPAYEGIFWLTGPVDGVTTAEARLGLSAYLDAGAHVALLGDGNASALGGPSGQDPTFLATYFGTEFPEPSDSSTVYPVLGVEYQAFVCHDQWVQDDRLSIYGTCPMVRDFDRLTLATPSPGSVGNVVGAYYSNGTTDDGRPALIKNTRIASGGVGVISGFGVGAVWGEESVTCLLHGILRVHFGLTVPRRYCAGNCWNGVPESTTPIAFSLSAPQPNPSSSTTTISFSLADRVQTQLSIYNVSGQRVASLENGTLEAGVYSRTWGGRDMGGSMVASGMYFVRIIAGDFRRTERIVRLR